MRPNTNKALTPDHTDYFILYGIALTRSPSIPSFFSFSFFPSASRTYTWTGASELGKLLLQPLYSALMAYATAHAANLPPTATIHVTVEPLDKRRLHRKLLPALQTASDTLIVGSVVDAV